MLWPLAAAIRRALEDNGAKVYQRNCAQCHDAGINRAPQRDAFLSMTPERVLAAMESGRAAYRDQCGRYRHRNAVAADKDRCR